MTLADQLASSRFQHHVSFDTFASGEATEKNTTAFTLNVKHKGYQFKRRSRTFMVGVGENDYSDIALQWMLGELVDDGDEIICVHVIDRDSKVVNDRNVEKREYQTEAKELLERIQIRNDDNRAIGIVLEFVAGKLHATFQRMIQLYEPAMLIVGTKGRSLGGLQGLMSNRNSFSKWCLQYSPIPVVVVRPTSKRLKKKKKRVLDPARQDYVRILRESGIEDHETDTTTHSRDWEISTNPEVEALKVAAAVGQSSGYESTFRSYQFVENQASKSLEYNQSGAMNGFRKIISSDISSSSGLASNLDFNLINTVESLEKGENFVDKMESNSCVDSCHLKRNISQKTTDTKIVDVINIHHEECLSELPSPHGSVTDASESILESPTVNANYYRSENESEKDETEFEVIPGNFLLKDSEKTHSERKKDQEELTLNDFLSMRATIFLAAQIARNLTMDELPYNHKNEEQIHT
ncbi:putative universal stress protein [Golovinomyces cichoracearum]|uniref:Putative universal stress protein n=1 Tax=Golovinomyces cichoracearum TaxID=62708 RepID=A0A420J9T1_9PEZI|nr:putative universal stress protein [Golovinomyces cichoracearum]